MDNLPVNFKKFLILYDNKDEECCICMCPLYEDSNN